MLNSIHKILWEFDTNKSATYIQDQLNYWVDNLLELFKKLKTHEIHKILFYNNKTVYYYISIYFDCAITYKQLQNLTKLYKNFTIFYNIEQAKYQLAISKDFTFLFT